VCHWNRTDKRNTMHLTSETTNLHTNTDTHKGWIHVRSSGFNASRLCAFHTNYTTLQCLSCALFKVYTKLQHANLSHTDQSMHPPRPPPTHTNAAAAATHVRTHTHTYTHTHAHTHTCTLKQGTHSLLCQEKLHFNK